MREVAMLVTKKHFPLITIFGEPASVDFPVEYALKVHKRFPGLIRRMVHTHPEGMTFLSEEDRTTLKAWTMAFSPHVICMEVICYLDSQKRPTLYRKMFWYELEGLHQWRAGEKNKPREMKLLDSDLTGHKHPRWVKDIIKFSYL